jgi:hypothetical protein
MKKLSIAALVPMAVLMAAGAASGQQYAGHCSQCTTAYGPTYGQTYKDSYYESSMWPRQYISPARRGICQSYELMIANGWRRHNLLGKYDFAVDGEGLSEAGRLRVQWILTQAPPNRRTIFVQRGVDVAQTAVRIEAVQELAASMSPSVGPADVQETYLRDDGHPASTVDAVFTGFSANQMAPVLPESGGGSSSESE